MFLLVKAGNFVSPKEEGEKGYLPFKVALIIQAIASIVLSTLTFRLFEARSGEYNELLKNWGTPPITSLSIVPASDDCPAEYSRLPLPTWPGAKSSGCACPEDAQWEDEYLSSNTDGSCSKKHINAGCISSPGIAGVKLTAWRGSALCVKHDGDAQVKEADGAVLRPVPKNNNCDTGHTLCGTGPYAICMPGEGVACPLTAAETTATTTSPPDTFAVGQGQTFVDGGSVLWTRDATGAADDGMPINGLIVALYDPTDREKRVDCFAESRPSKLVACLYLPASSVSSPS